MVVEVAPDRCNDGSNTEFRIIEEQIYSLLFQGGESKSNLQIYFERSPSF